MGRTVDWARQARTDLRKLSKRDSDRIRRAVLRLAASGLGDVEHLKGISPPLYRLRVGDWRVTFRYEEVGWQDDGLSVKRVLHRRDAYRKSGVALQEIPRDEGLGERQDWDTQERISD